MSDAEAVDEALSEWDPRRRAALEKLWAGFETAGTNGTSLSTELITERRQQAAAEDNATDS